MDKEVAMKQQKGAGEQAVTLPKKISEPMQRRTVTVEQAGEILGISRASAYTLAGTGEIPTIKLGRRRLVPKAALDRLLGEI